MFMLFVLGVSFGCYNRLQQFYIYERTAMPRETDADRAATKLIVVFVRETNKKRLAPFAPFTEEELESRQRRVAELKKQYPDADPELVAELDDAVEQIRVGLEEQNRRKK
jgi:hypothetical protein